MNKWLSSIVYLAIWFYLNALAFRYATIWSFNTDPGIKGPLLYAISIQICFVIICASLLGGMINKKKGKDE